MMQENQATVQLSSVEEIPCPYCGSTEYVAWAEEVGFHAVRCSDCNLIYCNPRPKDELISRAVQCGLHAFDGINLNVKARRTGNRVARYKNLFSDIFRDLWKSGKSVKWLDVGAGYGEVLEALSTLASPGSVIEGLEPMRPKAEVALSRGLNVKQDYLHPNHDKVEVISVIDVFSHIPDFRSFLLDVVSVLEPQGELFIETGNLADVESRRQFPGELGLPDHLVFAGESHLVGYLDEAGFDVVSITRERSDGMLNFIKQIVKKSLGRSAQLCIPYTSSYRQVFIRARLRS